MASTSTVVLGRGPSSLVAVPAPGQLHRDDLPLEEAVFLGGDGPVLRESGKLVHLAPVHVLALGDVLGRLAHGDVDVGQTLARLPGIGHGGGTRHGALLGVGELGVVRSTVGHPLGEPAHRLDACGHEYVALAGLDGVGSHADGLEGRGAVAVEGDAGDFVEAGQDRHHPSEVETGLARGLGTTEEQVLDGVGVELGQLGEHRAHGVGGKVVGPTVDEAALEGASDRGTSGGDDHCFGHQLGLLGCLSAHALGARDTWASRPSREPTKGYSDPGRAKAA